MNSVIKNKLDSFVSEYQEKLGTFNGNLVIYDFIEYITNNPAIKEVMKDQFAYCESQKEVLLNMPEDDLDVCFNREAPIDPMDPSTWPNGPVFTKEHETASSIATSSQPFSLNEINLPISLSYLTAVHMLVSQAREELSSNPEKSKEITQVIKELSTTLIPFKYQDKDEVKSLSLSLPAYCLHCLNVVSTYITSELASKDFLLGNKQSLSIRFDKDESILTIKEDVIRISRASERPIDHFILEAIFDKEDISEEVYFKDVARRIDEYADYDNTKDWRSYYRACERLNQKIQTSTSQKVFSFIESHTGKRAWCKINPKYLKY